ncbi:hypothetical protein SKAU_G00083020 [Synaphobranchus kaupii]|uniref:DUF4939 domain-containing protein n=1 Tax=Synaphobranchus kaupii TaxID=118154 RepID=A0A9Q1FUV0_SYNKA|nr:hypothetical protein SKAU_G00083020 [Synaphobranchus kaupii]
MYFHVHFNIHHRLLCLILSQSPAAIRPCPQNSTSLHPIAMPVVWESVRAQCSQAFEVQPSSFPTERSKVAFVISRLSGRSLTWATAMWEQSAPACSNIQLFAGKMSKVFDQPGNYYYDYSYDYWGMVAGYVSDSDYDRVAEAY